MNQTARHVSLATKLFYGFGSVAYGVKDAGFGFFLLLYYDQVLGLPSERVGLAIMLALIVDALSDPVVGLVSDRWHSRWGRRHPFMYASALPVAISYFFLWNPPDLGPDALFLYLLFVAIAVRTFITFYEVPSTSLVAELTESYDDRTSILGYRYFFGWWGGLTLSVIAYSLLLQPSAEHPVGQLNPVGYQNYGMVACGLMLFAILTSALGTHDQIPHLRKPPHSEPFSARRTGSELLETFSNRNFLSLFFSAIFVSMAAGTSASLNIYINTFFWELSSDQILYVVLGNFPAALLGFVLAPLVSRHTSKKSAAILSAALVMAFAPVPIVLRLLDLMPANGDPLLLPILVAFNVGEIGLFVTASILFSSMVADIVEDSELSTGRRSEGLFFAARSFAQKAVSGLGIFSATVLLTLAGFPEGAQPGEVEPSIVQRLVVSYIPALGVIYFLSIGCIFGYRISRESHTANLEQLHQTD